ncbi:hypothetical protein NG812_01555 [Lactococcus garvieae]|uniref:DUF6273 domain-containing protein n=1 Tax=Lactococcus garvieae TaxID=1363 RepID=A0AAX3NB78_9LACT|nr:DUF6273 domain-containing protein [Lactococcus garvieae]NHI70275.1 hypothetical protein [Lactococcus garvieae]NHJ06998.1 hypothetical protein [Lactococcus garvieae]WEA13970.1 hypothetical protein PWF74_00360 [Lactococcus garvieae]
MTPEKKRKLRNIAILSLLGLIGVTFAFQAFNQQAINDRLRENTPGGRVHDYYNRNTENKDVFVENFGTVPLMARVRLSEFLESRSPGETAFTPLVAGTTRENIDSWTTWIPSSNNTGQRESSHASNAFNRYSNLILGWSRSGQSAPWFMPTFNHNNLDLSTAAAGHARDYIAGSGATDATTDGTTHPGDGTDAYWSSGDTYDNSGATWPGETVTHQAIQNLPQDRAPMTIAQWANLPNNEKVGNFWVIDYQTGWAYWANRLRAGEATSYLLDAAEMTAETDTIPGEYYYGIHVDSQLISPDRTEEFLGTDSEGAHHTYLPDFLDAVSIGSIDNNWGNPGPDEDSQPGDINFRIMAPGTIFTMAGEQYRYLENLGSGNHMIIRNHMFPNTTFNNQNTVLESWYGQLDTAVQSIVQPVYNEFTTGMFPIEDAGDGSHWWIVDNLDSNPEVVADVTRVTQGAGSSPQAFALSLADVNRLSGEDLAFPNPVQRLAAGGDHMAWWTRTPSTNLRAWTVSTQGTLFTMVNTYNGPLRGVRPALIIHQ